MKNNVLYLALNSTCMFEDSGFKLKFINIQEIRYFIKHKNIRNVVVYCFQTYNHEHPVSKAFNNGVKEKLGSKIGAGISAYLTGNKIESVIYQRFGFYLRDEKGNINNVFWTNERLLEVYIEILYEKRCKDSKPVNVFCVDDKVENKVINRPDINFTFTLMSADKMI